jgi:hypothetical protein
MVSTLLIGLALAGVMWWSTSRVVNVLHRIRTESASQRTLELLTLFTPGVVAATHDPRALLAWHPTARAARTLFPAEFAALDRAFETSFPFGPAQIRDAHARWTASWLAWEGAHDAEYKIRAATLEQELGDQAGSALGRARLEAVAREKLDKYQRQYEDYTRVSRALRTLGGDG